MYINRQTTYKTNILRVPHTITPATHINNKALKMHKLTDGKQAKLERPIEIAIIIRPNCLKVDKTIILFKSHPKFTPRPAISIVSPETNNKIILNQ